MATFTAAAKDWPAYLASNATVIQKVGLPPDLAKSVDAQMAGVDDDAPLLTLLGALALVCSPTHDTLAQLVVLGASIVGCLQLMEKDAGKTYAMGVSAAGHRALLDSEASLTVYWKAAPPVPRAFLLLAMPPGQRLLKASRMALVVAMPKDRALCVQQPGQPDVECASPETWLARAHEELAVPREWNLVYLPLNLNLTCVLPASSSAAK